MVGHPSQPIVVFNDKYERTQQSEEVLTKLRLLQDLEEVEMGHEGQVEGQVHGHEGQVHAYDPRGDQLTRTSEQQESRVVTLKLPDQV